MAKSPGCSTSADWLSFFARSVRQNAYGPVSLNVASGRTPPTRRKKTKIDKQCWYGQRVDAGAERLLRSKRETKDCLMHLDVDDTTMSTDRYLAIHKSRWIRDYPFDLTLRQEKS